ncbi:hypothetical protein DPMN_172506 [Dreissena polymorpha]|uniref:Uncharacterized protein n=1 Tax=Dreissena polymorpha TaxID=45954 RepID=A0A9D4IG48_DREPO|nr:hypothetical protein DPMN_172506 [Dreissena polymorpha]
MSTPYGSMTTRFGRFGLTDTLTSSCLSNKCNYQLFCKIATYSDLGIYKEECAKLVKLFGWEEYIDYHETYPGSDISFRQIKIASGSEFCDMLYFDDEKEHLAELAY